MIIRPIKKEDLEGFIKLANSSSLGITNLPKNRELLEEKINDSIAAFSKKSGFPKNEKYIFVLESQNTKEIGGTCGILSKTGVDYPIYFYRIETKKLTHEPHQIRILKAVSYKKEPSEIAGLYLHPEFRNEGLGKLLSFSRFLFIAAFKERFEKKFFAEIRGVILENGIAPFWEGLGRHFLNVDYNALMKLAETGRGFIKEILPKYPIYIELLEKHAIEVIGKPHDKSKAAFNMLESQGFKFVNEIDIFDGGPRVISKTSKIKTIKMSVLGVLKAITDEDLVSDKYMMSNERLDFRAAMGALHLITKHEVLLNSSLAKSLDLNIGDPIRYVKV